MPKDYKILFMPLADELAKLILEYINEGYTPIGQPYFADGKHFQAVFKGE